MTAASHVELHRSGTDPSLARLVELGALLAGQPTEKVERLALALLGSAEHSSWTSTLNNDGSPLQVCLSLPHRGSSATVRFIADPAAEAVDELSRRRRAYLALSALLASHAPSLESLCNQLLESTLPKNAATRAALPGGGIWLSADLMSRGMAVYATAKWGDSCERWRDACRWLNEILPASPSRSQLLDRLATRTVLVSVGLEGSSLRDARLKLYWRLERTASLNDLALSLFAGDDVGRFLNDVVEDRRIPRAGIVGSIGFQVASGEVCDGKLDVCGHCVKRPASEWIEVIDRSIGRYSLVAPPVGLSALFGYADLAFIGLGIDSKQRSRLNIYLKRSQP